MVRDQLNELSTAVTKEKVEAYRRDGHVCIRGMIDAETVSSATFCLVFIPAIILCDVCFESRNLSVSSVDSTVLTSIMERKKNSHC